MVIHLWLTYYTITTHFKGAVILTTCNIYWNQILQ